MRFDAQCPACGIVVKRVAVSGRYEGHGWINGCEYVGGPPHEERPTAVRTRRVPSKYPHKKRKRSRRARWSRS